MILHAMVLLLRRICTNKHVCNHPPRDPSLLLDYKQLFLLNQTVANRGSKALSSITRISTHTVNACLHVSFYLVLRAHTKKEEKKKACV